MSILQDEKKEHLKKYRREYYRKKYNTDEEYKESKKSYNKKTYINKCVKCTKCFKRFKTAELDDLNINYSDNFICDECQHGGESQYKCKRGRPKKII